MAASSRDGRMRCNSRNRSPQQVAIAAKGRNDRNTPQSPQQDAIAAKPQHAATAATGRGGAWKRAFPRFLAASASCARGKREEGGGVRDGEGGEEGGDGGGGGGGEGGRGGEGERERGGGLE